ncbi:MAG: GumC family protein [Caulobacterales bacterium]
MKPEQPSAFGLPSRVEPIQSGFAEELRRIVQLYRRRVGAFWAGVIGTMLATLLAVLQLTPQYTATTTVIIDPRQKQVIDMSAVMQGLPADSAAIDTQVGIIKSDDIAKRLVNKLDLVNDAEFNKAAKGKGGLFAGLFGAPAKVDPARVTQGVIDGVQKRIKVRREGMTLLIGISFKSKDPAKAALIANTIAELYLTHQLEAKFDATRRANVWLNERVAELKSDVDKAENAVAQYKADAGLITASGATLVESQLTNLNTQLVTARADLAEREARLNSVRARMSQGFGADAVAEALNNQTIRDLRTQQAQIIRKKAELESTLGPRHPDMQRINREQNDLDQQINDEVKRIVANFENEVVVARQRVASLQGSLSGAEGQMAVNNRALVRLNELDRNAQSSRALYETYLQRFKQTSEQQGLPDNDASVLSVAGAPTKPSEPQIPMILAVALLLGLGVGAAAVLIMEAFDSGFRLSEELEEQFGAPTLASVPFLKPSGFPGEPALVPDQHVIDKPLSTYAEAFRVLKVGLAMSGMEKAAKVVLFTSALPGEGKTVNSLSFARSLAASGAKVLVIDGDVRRRDLSQRVGGHGLDVGIVEVITGEKRLEDAIMQDPKSAAYVLPCSNRKLSLADVFASGAYTKLLERLRGEFDMIVIDAAPVLAVADTLTQSGGVDAVVVNVRWGKTPRALVVKAVAELRKIGAPLAGMILSQVDLRGQARYGSGLGYGYYGAYAQYYRN